MCGRFTLTLDATALQDQLPGFTFPPAHAARYNIAPTQPILAVPNDEKRSAGFFVWGLIPAWAKDPAIGNRLINARAETLAEKPAFRGGLKYKRCLIIADGFFEWQAVPGTRAKQPYYIQLTDGSAFALAGLWDRWQGRTARN
jgi:putative SOS response-associated peptidase YedK